MRCIINFKCDEPFEQLIYFYPDQYAILYRVDWENLNNNSKLFYLYPDGSTRRISDKEESENKYIDRYLENTYRKEEQFAVEYDSHGPYIIDRKGNITVNSGIYKYINGRSRSGIFAAGYDDPNKEGVWIDPRGNIIPEFPEKLDDRKTLLQCEGGLTHIFSDMSSGSPRWGIMNKEGKILIEPVYRAVGCFKDGYAWIADDVKHQWCPIGPNGAEKVYPKCVDQMIPILKSFIGEKLSDDPYESSVLWMQAFLEYVSGFRETAPKKYDRYNQSQSKEPYNWNAKNE